MTTSLTDIGKQLGATSPAGNGSPAATTPAAAPSTPTARRPGKEPVVVLPAGFFGDLISDFAGTIGQVAGGVLGDAQAGQQVGQALSPIARMLPFTVLPPSVAPSAAGPGSAQGGPDQAMVVVPAGFIGGLLGGIGGNLLGGAIGGLFGQEQTGKTIGSTAGSILGGLLPFQVVPPALAPQSTGPDGQQKQDPMIVVPAGFFGDLLSGVAKTISASTDDSTVSTIADVGSKLAGLLPFSEVPPDVLPQDAAPDGQAAPQDRLVVLPAGFFGNMLSGLAETVGAAVGGALGDSQAGQSIGAAAKPLLQLLPFHTLPPQLAPQVAGPDAGKQEELLVVPAGLFGGLLSTFAGAIGGVVGGLAGDAQAGQAIGNTLAPVLSALPFTVVAPRTASTGS